MFWSDPEIGLGCVYLEAYVTDGLWNRNGYCVEIVLADHDNRSEQRVEEVCLVSYERVCLLRHSHSGVADTAEITSLQVVSGLEFWTRVIRRPQRDRGRH